MQQRTSVKAGELSPSPTDNQTHNISISLPLRVVSTSIDITNSDETANKLCPAPGVELVSSEPNTLPYWISINFIFGSLLYTSGSFFWIIDDYLTENDYFTLVTVAFFSGGTAFGIGSYINYYGIINTPNPGFKTDAKQRTFCCHSGQKSMNYYIALIFLIGTICYYVNSVMKVFGIYFERGSFKWYAFRMSLYVIGGSCFCFGGMLDIYSNINNRTRSAVSWIISLSNWVGGFMFFVGAIGLFFENVKIVFWLAEMPYIIGSTLYLFTSILGLYIWRKQNGPHAGANNSIIFLCLYIIALAVAVTAIVYASLCEKYMDWIKNFVLATMASIAVLAMGSFMKSEHINSKPFKYIVWFSRCFMLLMTFNLIVDAYHLSILSGYGCKDPIMSTAFKQFYGK